MVARLVRLLVVQHPAVPGHGQQAVGEAAQGAPELGLLLALRVALAEPPGDGAAELQHAPVRGRVRARVRVRVRVRVGVRVGVRVRVGVGARVMVGVRVRVGVGAGVRVRVRVSSVFAFAA